MINNGYTILNFGYGGLEFQVEADAENEYVIGINKVAIWNNKDKRYVEVSVDDSSEFMDTFEDSLQEAYREYLEDLEIAAAEERMDCEREEKALENWNKNN